MKKLISSCSFLFMLFLVVLGCTENKPLATEPTKEAHLKVIAYTEPESFIHPVKEEEPERITEQVALQNTPLANSKKIASFRFRKYAHVTKLYQRLSKPVTDLCVANKVPPAAILAILSLESGWGQGYIGLITGNFMSLNATGNRAELPALYLPKHIKSGKVLFDTTNLSQYAKHEIKWEQRPPCLKQDYRPVNIAGTTNQLTYFSKRPNELTKANLANVKDFVSRFISTRSRISAYREARQLLTDEIAKHGISILFNKAFNERFIKTIGGRPNSFNFRETWPKKVIKIMHNVGAIELTKELYEKKSFVDSW
ncbi:MAG: hypothetical protein AB8B61_04085 [Cyclobacteriaceae bacterium]